MKNNAFSKRRRKDLIFYICILIIPLTQFCLFYIGVHFNSVLLAFKSFDRATGQYFFNGFDNFRLIYVNLSDSDLIWKALGNSLIAYAAGVLVGVTLSLLFSFYIYKKMAGYSFFKVVLFMPSIISSIAMVIMFKYFAERAIPDFINTVFHTHIEGLLSNPSMTFGMLVFYSIWISFGSGILMYTGAMGNISESVIEAAKLDGATLMQEFFHIAIPLIWPTLTTFLVVGVAGIFTNQLNLYTFFSGSAEPHLYTIGYYLFKDLRSPATIAEYPYLAALGIALTLIAAPLTIGIKKLLERVDPTR